MVCDQVNLYTFPVTVCAITHLTIVPVTHPQYKFAWHHPACRANNFLMWNMLLAWNLLSNEVGIYKKKAIKATSDTKNMKIYKPILVSEFTLTHI